MEYKFNLYNTHDAVFIIWPKLVLEIVWRFEYRVQKIFLVLTRNLSTLVRNFIHCGLVGTQQNQRPAELSTLDHGTWMKEHSNLITSITMWSNGRQNQWHQQNHSYTVCQQKTRNINQPKDSWQILKYFQWVPKI